MVWCKMNMRGLCAVFCFMIIYTVEVCDAECDEYVVVFEETTCFGHVKIKTLKGPEINWDKVTYPCNSTEKNPGKKKCVVAFECLGTVRSCQQHIKIVNHQTHSFIDLTAKPIASTTEALHVSKSNNTNVSKSNNTDVPKSNNTHVHKSNNTHVLKSNNTHVPKSNNTHVPKSNITNVSKSNNTDVPKSNNTHVHKSNNTHVPKSNNTNVSKSNNTDVPKSNNTNVPKSNNTNVSKSNNTDVPKSNNTHVHKSNNTHVLKSNNTHVPKSNNTNVSKSNNTDVPKSNNTNVSKSNNTDVPKSNNTHVHKSNNTHVLNSNNTHVLKSNNTHVPKSNITNVSKSNNTDVPKSNNTHVHKSNNTNVSKSNNTDVPKSNITNVSKSNNTDVPKSNNTHVHKSNITNVSKSNNTDVPKSNNTHVPKSNNTNVSKSNNTDVPKSNNTHVHKSNNTHVLKSNNTHVSKSNNTDVPKINNTHVHKSNNTHVLKSNNTHVPKSNITVEEKPHHTVDEELNTSTYDVNLIYIKDNVIQDSSKTSVENCTLYCDYAETVCVDGEKSENYSVSDVKNVHSLVLAINRDETSPVQPVFTGYFPELSNDNSKNYKNHLIGFKTLSLSCSSLKYKNCKQNIENKSSKQMNVYIKANCIENNTITKYPDCTKSSITSENVLDLKCEDILFVKHNPHIVQKLPTPPPKLSIWNCQITELKTLSSKEQRSDNSKIHFINCSNETNISTNKNKYKDIIVSPISDNKTINIYNILTKNRIEMNKTEISTGNDEINKDLSSQENPENIITILLAEKSNNCSNYSYFNFNQGKIIDLGINKNKEKILQNNNVELILSNCINVSSSTINETQPHPKAELSIILKNESLNTSNLKHFNGTPEDLSVKRRILLRCDNPNLDLSSNKTILECESINLGLYNITGIEITLLSQTSNNTTAIATKTKQEESNWNCEIFELNDTLSPKEQQSEKSKLYFKNCATDVYINDNKNKSGDNSATPIFDSKNSTNHIITTTTETIDSTKDDIKRNKTEMLTGKLVLNTDHLSRVSPENMIKIVVTKKASNCSNNPSLNIDEGKIIDLDANNNEKKFLKNNIVELKLSSCIDIDSSSNNETQPNSKVELTIVLKNESLNDANLKQFNGTAKVGSVKQKILLRCDHPQLDSNTTVLQCESIDLDLCNITGIEITSVSPTPKLNANNTKEKKKENMKIIEENHNKNKVNTEVNKNNNFSINKTVEKNEGTVNNKINENNTKVVRIEEVQKKVSESEENLNNFNFYRKKDIPVGAGQNTLDLANPETERILLISLLTVASVAILIVIALRACPKKEREYNPAPTREPPNEEETAF